MENTGIEIKTYKDFVGQLKKLQDEQTAAMLSFYKWCAKHRQEIHSVYVECIKDDYEIQVHFIHYGYKKYFDIRDYDYNNASIPYDHRFKNDFILGGAI